MTGNHGMYRIRPDYIVDPFLATSIYNLLPLRETLSRVIDLHRLNSNDVTRVSLEAVNVATSELVAFNNRSGLSFEHIIASASLPPSFPMTRVGSDSFWDGGLISNTPLSSAINCLEELEHIENPQQAIREFARLLRPGGKVIVSVPNILNIEERLKWLLYGYTSHFKPMTRAQVERLRAEYDNREEIAAHVNPIGYSELRYILEKYGFQIEGVHRDKPKANAWLYWPIVLLIRLIARLTPAAKRRERWTEELASDEVLLGGNTLIVYARLGDIQREI